MALNIKNREVERLATELAHLTGETKTEAIRTALKDRLQRLVCKDRRLQKGESFLRYLEEEVWPRMDEKLLGRRPSREEEDELLGYDLRG